MLTNFFLHRKFFFNEDTFQCCNSLAIQKDVWTYLATSLISAEKAEIYRHSATLLSKRISISRKFLD